MAAVTAFPGTFSSRNAVGGDIQSSQARLQGLSIPQTRTSTSYLAYTASRQDVIVPRLQLPVQDEAPPGDAKAPQSSYCASPVTPDELFIPGIDLPKGRNLRAAQKQISQSLVLPQKSSAARFGLRVDTSIRGRSVSIPSLVRPGGFINWGKDIDVSVPTAQSASVNSVRQRSISNIENELFLETPTPVSIPSLHIHTVLPTPSNVEALVPSNIATDWGLYDPPLELQRPPNNTFDIIDRIMRSSIAKIQERFKAEGPAAIELQMTESTQGLVGISFGESTMFSKDALSPAEDSGYGSTSPSSGTACSPRPVSSPRPNIAELNGMSVWGAPLPWKSCATCLEEFETSEMVILTCHSYCGDCFLKLVNTALDSEEQWPAKCCHEPVPFDTLITHITGPMKKKYRQRSNEWSIPSADRIYCPMPACNEWIPPKKAKYKNQPVKCGKCGFQVCSLCRSPSHEEGKCPPYNELEKFTTSDERDGRRGSNSYGEKADPAAETKFKHPTPPEPQRKIPTQWHKPADIDSQNAITNLTNPPTTLHFPTLKVSLNQIHQSQSTSITERHEFSLEMLKRDRQNALAFLSLRHPRELADLATESASRLAAAKHQLSTELQARIAASKSVREASASMVGAWEAGAGGGEEVRVVQMRTVKSENSHCVFWESYQKEKIRNLKLVEKCKMEALEARHANEIRAVERKAVGDEAGLKRRMEADWRWFEVVGREREVMLREAVIEGGDGLRIWSS